MTSAKLPKGMHAQHLAMIMALVLLPFLHLLLNAENDKMKPSCPKHHDY